MREKRMWEIVIMKQTLIVTLLVGYAIALTGCNEEIGPEDVDILPILIDETLYLYHFELTQDPFEFEDVQIKYDLLNINVSYIGGCGVHDFSLIASELWAASNPPGIFTVLTHSSATDTCNTRVFKELFFDLQTLRDLEPIFILAIRNGPTVLYGASTR